jgi:hypothetical protein
MSFSMSARSEAAAEYYGAAHGRPGGVDERQSAANGEDQSGRGALRGYGTAAGENLFEAGGESCLCARRHDVDFQYVADVIDVAHHAGVQRVGLLIMDRAVAGE